MLNRVSSLPARPNSEMAFELPELDKYRLEEVAHGVSVKMRKETNRIKALIDDGLDEPTKAVPKSFGERVINEPQDVSVD